MNSSEEQKGAGAPNTGGVPPADQTAPGHASSTYDDGYPHEPENESPVSYSAPPVVKPVVETGTRDIVRSPGNAGGGKTPPSPPSGGDGGDDEDDRMLRMSFLEHLEELRSRIIRALIGVGVAFAASIFFTDQLWNFVTQPAMGALKELGFNQTLSQITPMEVFNVVYVKLPILCAIFIASPWILYQVWAFIAPGLYERERKWAVPFVCGSASLFILGGVFAYFVAFRFGLTFLLGLGRGHYITPMVTVTEYFDLFVNVTLGVGLVFELPVVLFFLILLRIVTPSFLIRNSRYAILAIFVVAAIVTPTPDVFNLMMFAAPMCLLFYVGIFAGYLLVLHREHRRFPWKKAMTIVLPVLLLLALVLYLAITKYGMRLVPHWPFLTR
jgi:sec-independent protein translocase protein TatC